MDRIRELTREIRKQHLLIDNFIPPYEYMKIERRAELDEMTGEFIIPNNEFTGNNIKRNKAKKKEGHAIDGDQRNQFLYENILNMEESEDEDF